MIFFSIVDLCFILFVLLVGNFSVAQNKQNSELLELSIVNNSNNRLSSSTHFYELQLVNNSNKAIEYTIVTKEVKCKKNTSKLHNEVISNQGFKLETQKILSQESYSFKIKLTRNHLTKLNTWNCIEIGVYQH